MRRRVLLGLGFLVLLAAVVGLLLLGSLWETAPRDARESAVTSDGGGAPARLGGRATGTEPSRRGIDERLVSVPLPESLRPPAPDARPVVRGRLEAEDGGRLAEPRVWLTPKGSRGDRRRWELKSAGRVDASGQWTMRGDPGGQWIGGLAAGYRPTFLDGDEWDGREVVLRLERGRRIEVSVTVDTPDVQPDPFVMVTPNQEATWDYPDPGSEASVTTHQALPRPDQAFVHTSMNGSIRVRVYAPGFVATPEHVDLGPDEHGASFHLARGCRVELTVRDAETGCDLAGATELYACAKPVDREAEGLVLRELRDFAGDMENEGLALGTYRIFVVGAGFESWTSDVVDLTRPGQEVEVEARLQPSPETGRLLLEIAPPAGGSLEGARLSALVGLPQADGHVAWGECPTMALGEDAGRYLIPALAPREIHLMAWTGPVAVGWLESLTIEAGQTTRARLALRPGTLVRLVAPFDTRGGIFFGDVKVSLRSPAGLKLPIVCFDSRAPISLSRETLSSSHGYRDEAICAPVNPSLDAVLGPYPFSALLVEGPAHELVPND